MRRPEEARRRALAFHEAAHAVACYGHGRQFSTVTIRADDTTWGRVAGVQHRRPRSADLVDVVRVVILLVGARAERRAVGRVDRVGRRADLQEAVFIAAGGACADVPRFEESPLVRGIITGAQREAGVFLDRWWPAVEAVAGELLAQQTLTMRQLADIVEAPEIQAALSNADDARRAADRDRLLRRLRAGLRSP